MNNQCERILKHLRDNGSITNMEAMWKYSITSPTRRITDLRQYGYNVTDVWEHGTNKFGEPVRYKRYFLKEEKGAV